MYTQSTLGQTLHLGSMKTVVVVGSMESKGANTLQVQYSEQTAPGQVNLTARLTCNIVGTY